MVSLGDLLITKKRCHAAGPRCPNFPNPAGLGGEGPVGARPRPLSGRCPICEPGAVVRVKPGDARDVPGWTPSRAGCHPFGSS